MRFPAETAFPVRNQLRVQQKRQTQWQGAEVEAARGTEAAAAAARRETKTEAERETVTETETEIETEAAGTAHLAVHPLRRLHLLVADAHPLGRRRSAAAGASAWLQNPHQFCENVYFVCRGVVDCILPARLDSCV